MQQSIGNYFYWDTDPNMLNIGSIHLPFSISIYGIILGLILFFWGVNKMTPDPDQSKNKRRRKQAEPEVWKIWALGIGAFVLGQIVFIIIPSPMIHQIGPIRIRWYGLLFAMAFVSGYFIEKRLFKDAGRTLEELEMLLTYILVATIIGARLGHVIFYDLHYYLTHPSEIIKIWHGGLASHGAAIAIIIAMWLYVRKKKDMNFLWLADRVVMPVAIGGAFIRLGNFFNSEIIGHVTHVPWAVVFARVDMLPRHPSMLYESVLSILTFALLWWVYRKYDRKPPEGGIFGIFLILLFTGRFLIEYTKMPQANFAANWPLSMGQILSIPLVLYGVWLVWKKVDWKKQTTLQDT